jgi:hypothetical protein
MTWPLNFHCYLQPWLTSGNFINQIYSNILTLFHKTYTIYGFLLSTKHIIPALGYPSLWVCSHHHSVAICQRWTHENLGYSSSSLASKKHCLVLLGHMNIGSPMVCDVIVTINPVIVLGSFKPHKGWTLANQGLHSVVTFLQFIYKIYNEK